MIDVLQALADPRRLEILRVLKNRELPAGEIAARFSLRRPTVSYHLAVLEGAGLVSVRKQRNQRIYSIRTRQFEQVQTYLETFWQDNLERLKDAAEEHDGGIGRGERN